ncbi:membrane protein [Candidatus Omnitrophus magneticus]|uniref:Membrane protein n=1 Tax=Candidatus Omnitrophus magneticus TaxID=1609969 RepID=A0A0F0CNW2_9BACT|nr:membrane protein [Candidatus Omnitrophus magneticus]
MNTIIKNKKTHYSFFLKILCLFLSSILIINDFSFSSEKKEDTLSVTSAFRPICLIENNKGSLTINNAESDTSLLAQAPLIFAWYVIATSFSENYSADKTKNLIKETVLKKFIVQENIINIFDFDSLCEESHTFILPLKNTSKKIIFSKTQPQNNDSMKLEYKKNKFVWVYLNDKKIKESYMPKARKKPTKTIYSKTTEAVTNNTGSSFLANIIGILVLSGTYLIAAQIYKLWGFQGSIIFFLTLFTLIKIIINIFSHIHTKINSAKQKISDKIEMDNTLEALRKKKRITTWDIYEEKAHKQDTERSANDNFTNLGLEEPEDLSTPKIEITPEKNIPAAPDNTFNAWFSKAMTPAKKLTLKIDPNILKISFTQLLHQFAALTSKHSIKTIKQEELKPLIGSDYKAYKPKTLLLFTDSIVYNFGFFDLKETLQFGFFKQKDIFLNGTIVLYGAPENNILIEKIINTADKKINILTINKNTLIKTLSAKNKNFSEIDEITRAVKTAKQLAAKNVGITTDFIGIIKGKTKDAIKIETLCEELGMPIVIYSNERGLFSFRIALIELFNRRYSGDKNKWLYILLPLIKLSEETAKSIRKIIIEEKAVLTKA